MLICTFQRTKQTSSKECNFNLHYREKWETQKRCKSRIRNICNKKVVRKHNLKKKALKTIAIPHFWNNKTTEIEKRAKNQKNLGEEEEEEEKKCF